MASLHMIRRSMCCLLHSLPLPASNYLRRPIPLRLPVISHFGKYSCHSCLQNHSESASNSDSDPTTVTATASDDAEKYFQDPPHRRRLSRLIAIGPPIPVELNRFCREGLEGELDCLNANWKILKRNLERLNELQQIRESMDAQSLGPDWFELISNADNFFDLKNNDNGSILNRAGFNLSLINYQFEGMNEDLEAYLSNNYPEVP